MVLLQKHERFEHRTWFASEQSFVAGLKQLIANMEALVDRLSRAAACRKNQSSEVLQHNRIQLADFNRSAIEALHQMLTCAPVRGIAQSHLRGELGLHVEYQA